MDIRRQRHAPHAGEDVLEHAVIVKAHDALARLRHARNGQRKLFGDDELRTDPRLFAGADEHLPFGKVTPL